MSIFSRWNQPIFTTLWAITHWSLSVSKKILPLLSLISLNPLNPKTMQIIQKKEFNMKISENIHQWCPFWTASAVKDFMFRTKNQECLQASIEGKKSKKEFLFSVYNMDKRKPWMWYFPLKWSSLEMTLSQRLWTHTKKKIPKRNKKKLKNCALIRSASMHHHQNQPQDIILP